MLGSVDINRGIFQGNSSSPLLLIMIMALLSMILKDEQKGYEQLKTAFLGSPKHNYVHIFSQLTPSAALNLRECLNPQS